MANTKLVSMLGIFAIALFTLSLASALVFDGAITSVPQNINHDDGSFDILLYVNYTGALDSTNVSFGSSSLTSGSGQITINSITIQKNHPTNVIATVTFNENQNGNIAGAIVATPQSGTALNMPFSVQILNEKSLTIITKQPLTSSQNGILTITNTGNLPLTNIQLTSSGDFNANFSNSGFNLNAGNSIDVTISSTDLDNLDVGSNSVTVTARASDGTSTTRVVSVSGSLCRNGEVGNDLEISYIRDRTLDNDKEWEWRPYDNIELDVKVYNNNQDDDLDMVIKLYLLDENGNQIDFAEDEDDLEQDISIDSDKSETTTFNFQVAGDLDSGSNYKLYAKVYQDGDEDEQCAVLQAEDEDTEEDVKITRSTREVVVRNVEGPEAGVSCNTQVTFTGKVYNIGKSDEDRVRITLFNNELGIKLTKEIDNLDSEDYETISFSFNLPDTAAEGTYLFRFSTEYDYDDKDDTYDKVSKDEDDFKFNLKVLGNCQTSMEPIITATLISEAKVGENLVIQVSITNNGNSADFILTANGYEDWANLVSVEPSIIHIGKDETKQATLTLTPTESGSHQFTITAIYSGNTTDQQVSVNIAEKTGLLTGAFAGLGDTSFYIIAAVFLVLIILIIILIVKVAGSSRASSEF